MKINTRLHREILNIALPSIMTNLTVPILGIVDMAIVGHLGAASYIGAIAIGSNIFNMIYWIFAFLRMGTTGITSQAYGKKDNIESANILSRSLLASFGIGIVILIFQVPIRDVSLLLMSPGKEVANFAELYINICIWGAPAVLSLYSLTGWLLGRQNAGYPLYVALSQNIINICASLLFVLVWDMGVAGVALGTLLAQYAGLIVAVCCCAQVFKRNDIPFRWCMHHILNKEQIAVFFHVNRDIFFRTLCVVAVTVFFTAAGSRQGDLVLAANAVLMQFFTLYSFFMDGFAYAGEAISGSIYGSRDINRLQHLIRALYLWGIAVAALFTMLYLFGGATAIGWLTDEPSVAVCATQYLPWTWLIPLLALSAFLWDSIFIGLTATRQMLLSMAIATVAFFSVYLSLRNIWHNHALWCAFLVYLFSRGSFQHIIYKKNIQPKLLLSI